MTAGFILLAGAILAFIGISLLALRAESAAIMGWVGLLGMLVSSIVLVVYPDLPYAWGVALIWFVFLAGPIFAIYRLARLKSIADRGNSGRIRSEAIGGIMQVAATRDSLIELLNYSLDRILELFSLNSGAIHIYHSAKNMLVLGAYRGLSPIHASRLEMVSPGQSAIGRALQNKRVLIIRDLKLSPDFPYFGGKAEGYSFLAVSPIIVEDECWGVITLLGRKSYYRGLIEVSLLEQCGLQLGQALNIGRQNRLAAANFEKQKSIVDHLCQCLLGMDSKDKGSWLGQAVDSFPGGLFGGAKIVIITESDGAWRILYQHPDIETGPIQYQLDLALTLSGKMAKKDSNVQLRQISKKELSTNTAAVYFEKPELTALYFSFEGRHAIALVDLPRQSVEKSYAQDMQILQTLLKMAITTGRENDTSGSGQDSSREITDIISNAGSVLTEIKGQIDLLKAECEETRSVIAPERLIAKLKSISDDISLRSASLGKGQPIDLNAVISNLLKNHKLDVEFKPAVGPVLSYLPESEFAALMRDVLTGAFEGGRKISLSIGAGNGRVAITIAGNVRNDYNTDSLAEWSSRHDLIVNIVNRNLPLQRDEVIQSETSASSGRRRALIIESRDIIKGLLSDYLAKLGLEADAALTGAQALEKIANCAAKGEHYDLAITDMTLTDMSGVALNGLIKEKSPETYSILMASWGVTIAEETLRQSGIDAVIYKPFSLDQLRQAITSGSRRIG